MYLYQYVYGIYSRYASSLLGTYIGKLPLLEAQRVQYVDCMGTEPERSVGQRRASVAESPILGGVVIVAPRSEAMTRCRSRFGRAPPRSGSGLAATPRIDPGVKGAAEILSQPTVAKISKIPTPRRP